MICSHCKKVIADDSPVCPECGAELDSIGAARTVNGAGETDGKRSPVDKKKLWVGTRPLLENGLAILVTVFVIFAGTAGIPGLFGRRSKFAVRLTVVEKVVEMPRGWIRRQKMVTKYVVFAGAIVVSLLAMSKTLGVIENLPLLGAVPALNVALLVLSTAVIGLFAGRAKMVIFNPAGHLNWMFNSASFGLGIVCGIAMNFTRR